MAFVQSQTKSQVWSVIMARSEKRNALNDTMVGELSENISKALDDKHTRVIVLKAEGKAFSAGADLDYLQRLQTNSLEENVQDSQQLKELLALIYFSPKPVIAQVQGHAIAGGCGLMSVCDWAFAVPEAKFGYSEVRIGFIPALVSVFLSRKVPQHICEQLLLSGHLFSAEEAKTYGLVHTIVQGNKLEEKVFEFAQELIQKTSGESFRRTKELLRNTQNLGVREALEMAVKANAEARGTKDCKKGINSFLQKEEISWKAP